MITCIVKRKGLVVIKASGTAEDLMVETAALIQEVYQKINKQNPEAASGYKLALLGTLLDPESPVWKGGNHES